MSVAQSLPDGLAPDGAVPGGIVPDGAAPGGPVPDGPVPGGPAAGGPVSDGVVPGGPVPGDSGSSDAGVDIWTDGACKGNPGPGGWGALLCWGEHRRELWGGERVTTNNRMELTAVIESLRALRRSVPVTLHVDSTYVMQGVTSWMAGWKRNGWLTKDRKPVKNRELWQELDQELARHQVRWAWVKGHAGDPGNEKADELANRGVPRG